MNDADFRQLLEICTTLSDEQKGILRSVLHEQTGQLPALSAWNKNFKAHPRCQHCRSEDICKYGRQSNRQRYQYKTCGRTFNVLTGTPLAHLNVISVLDSA